VPRVRRVSSRTRSFSLSMAWSATLSFAPLRLTVKPEQKTRPDQDPFDSIEALSAFRSSLVTRFHQCARCMQVTPPA
jgi:hypothetical protein